MWRPPATCRPKLKRIGHTLKPLEIVVVNTSAGARYGQDDYIDTGCGMGKAATLWLLEQGVRVTGTDGWSWDAPFSLTPREASGRDRRCRADLGRPPRRARDRLLPHGEAVASWMRCPPHGFSVVACFPVKIDRASAGWTRAVAIIEE
jgi:kynurenine formamidase